MIGLKQGYGLQAAKLIRCRFCLCVSQTVSLSTGSTWVPLASVPFGAFVSISLLTNNYLASK